MNFYWVLYHVQTKKHGSEPMGQILFHVELNLSFKSSLYELDINIKYFEFSTYKCVNAIRFVWIYKRLLLQDIIKGFTLI